jgi:MucR family transcriptional regulator, transcriptional regulator of exopolysaccharide biosynthesis
MAHQEKLDLIAEVAAAYLRRNSVPIEQIGSVVQSVTRALDAAANGHSTTGTTETHIDGNDVARSARPEPAVPIKKSLQPDFLICLDCGIKAKTLKRHLGSAHQLTPEAYRARWDLPKDYPITAPAYSERRSKMAKSLGLGRKAAPAKTKGTRRKRAA